METRKIGKASLYRLNGDSPVVQGLKSLIRRHAKTMAHSEAATDLPVEEERLKAPIA